MQDSLLLTLRRATAAQHTRIEGVLRLDGPFPLDHYRRVLQAFELFLRAWEPRAEAALPAPMREWFRSRTRGDFARADLRALGAPPLDGRARVPAMADESAALGSLYVMEGSALGGQVIAKQARLQFGLTPDTGAAYFNGWGSRTGMMWKEFQQVLADRDKRGADRETASQAAVETFESLTHLFEGVAHAH